MKKYTSAFALFVLSMSGAGSAIAACDGIYMNATAVSSLLAGKIARSPAGCSTNCGWQELHQGGSGGALIEQHSNTAADPAETVGSWTVAGDGKVTHNYGTGGSYTYGVKNNGGTYSFCGPNGEFTFTVN